MSLELHTVINTEYVSISTHLLILVAPKKFKFEDAIDGIKADSADAFSKFTWSSMTFQLYFVQFWHCSNGPCQQWGSLGVCRTHGSFMCQSCNSTNREDAVTKIYVQYQTHTQWWASPRAFITEQRFIGKMMHWNIRLYIRYSHCKGFRNDKKAINTYQFSALNLQIMVVVVNLLILGWTLCPASLIIISWTRTCSTTVVQISSEITLPGLVRFHSPPLPPLTLYSASSDCFCPF